MAELVLKIGSNNRYEDGDIISAYSPRHILCMHTEWIYRLENRSSGGKNLPRTNQIARKWLDETYKFVAKRISKHEILKIYKNGDEKIITGPQYRWVINGQESVVLFPEYADDPRRKTIPDRVVSALYAAKNLGLSVRPEIRGKNKDWVLVEENGSVITDVEFELLDKEQMDVEAWLKKRLAFPKHRIFHDGNTLVWHGGKQDRSQKVLDSVWDTIEQHRPIHRNMPKFQRTPYLGEELTRIKLTIPQDIRQRLIKQGVRQLPPVKYFGDDRQYYEAAEGASVRAIVGGTQLRNQLFVVVDDFDDEEARQLTESEVDNTDPDNPVIVKRRKRKVDWKNDLNLTQKEVDEVLDKTRRVDWRGHPADSEDQRKVKQFNRTDIVRRLDQRNGRS